MRTASPVVETAVNNELRGLLFTKGEFDSLRMGPAKEKAKTDKLCLLKVLYSGV
jgi:hypothetical protein